MIPKFPIVVIGASAGGLEILLCILKKLDSPVAGSLFIVQHTGPESILADILGGCETHHVAFAQDGELVEPRRVYVAKPGKHLGFHQERVLLSDAPKENFSRPSIDWLFRSAASEFGPRVIGVILTGKLFDGAFGLKAIAEAGGTTMVQDPREASSPSMPCAALSATAVDFRLPAAEIAEKLNLLLRVPR